MYILLLDLRNGAGRLLLAFALDIELAYSIVLQLNDYLVATVFILSCCVVLVVAEVLHILPVLLGDAMLADV